MKKDTKNAYLRAEQRVKDIKRFYRNLFAFVIFTIVWVLFSHKIFEFMFARINVNTNDMNFKNWMDINLWLTPAVWGLILLIYGLYVFTNKFNFLKKWEKEKIEEYMTEVNEDAPRNQWE